MDEPEWMFRSRNALGAISHQGQDMCDIDLQTCPIGRCGYGCDDFTKTLNNSRTPANANCAIRPNPSCRIQPLTREVDPPVRWTLPLDVRPSQTLLPTTRAC